MDVQRIFTPHLILITMITNLFTYYVTSTYNPQSVEWTLAQQIKTPHPVVIDMAHSLLIQTRNYLKDSVGEACLAFSCTISLTTIPISKPDEAYITIQEYDSFTKGFCRKLLRTKVDIYNRTLVKLDSGSQFFKNEKISKLYIPHQLYSTWVPNYIRIHTNNHKPLSFTTQGQNENLNYVDFHIQKLELLIDPKRIEFRTLI